MSEPTIILAGLAVIAISLIFDYFNKRRRTAAQSSIDELRQTLDRVLTSALSQEKTLNRIRPVIYDLHKRTHTVSKGLGNRPS
jgi:Tfp pilus assembly protein PilE